MQECLRHGHVQIRPNVGGKPRNRARVADVALHTRRQWSVVPADVHLGIQTIDVPGRIAERELRPVQQEQIAPRHVDDVLTLEALGRSQCLRVEALSLHTHGLQSGDFLGNARRAPVGHLAVVLMAPGLHGKIGLRLESILDELRRELVPGGLRLVLWRRRRRRGYGGRWMTTAACQGGHRQYQQRSRCKNPLHHSALPGRVWLSAYINTVEESG